MIINSYFFYKQFILRVEIWFCEKIKRIKKVGFRINFLIIGVVLQVYPS